MSRPASTAPLRPPLPAPLARRFEAIVFDWDGTAVPDRRADASVVRRLVEEACAAGIEVAIVSGTHVDNVDGQLAARPVGPGGLVLALNRGSEVFSVDRDGPALVERRTATPEEDAALSHAARLTVERLQARGLRAEIVSERLNRRKIDLIPEPEWAEPPKARIGELLGAVEARLTAADIDGLADAVAIASAAATAAGLADPRVTSDAKHVEIGLTDKSDSARWIMRDLWRRGIRPGQVLVAGDELGPLGGLPGSDSNLIMDGASRATPVTVGVEPEGVPEGVVALGGGPASFVALLADQIARRHARELPVFDADPGWTLRIDDDGSLSERVHEALLTLADGRLGTRGSIVVGHPSDDPGVVLSGVYAGSGPETQLLSGPRWNCLAIADALGPATRRVLDLHVGTLSQELADPQLHALLLSSLARPATAVLRARGHGAGPGAPGGLQPPRDATTSETGADGDCTWMRVASAPGSIVAACHDRRDGEAGEWALDRIVCYEGEGAAARVADERAALDRLGEARELGFDRLLAEHRRAWAARWEAADIRIDGDPDLQLAVRLALFHLMASVPDRGEAAVGARGLSGNGYRGHVFWDSDVHVLPFLAATHPPAARAMLEYRLRRLPVALRAAAAQGRTGARFPWESAASGEDVTPGSVPDGRGGVGQVYTGRLAEHIVADVAWAAAHYIDWTGDRAFAAGPGLELLVQTARWWASRIELDRDGSGHIRDVMGPDEYHEHIDDNAYTNVMARWTLRRAAGAAPEGALDADERRRWLELGDALVDGYDPATGVYEQFAGFSALEPLVIADVAQRPVAGDVLLGSARTHAAQVVKQPDVLMLHYLVPDEVGAGSLDANLDFYEPRTALGSTLSPGVHAALLARAGRLEQARELVRLTARIDPDDIGHTTEDGVHMAAMGSVWRALSFGFAGLQPAGDALAIDPVAFPGLEALELRVVFRGSRIHVRITPDAFDVTAEPPTRLLVPGDGLVDVGKGARRFETRSQS